jgi:tRNA(His) guanylyltransferase
MFTAHYILEWGKFFPQKNLIAAPVFDARTVAYPNAQTIRDYFSWRQADCHVNNLYNTTFWNLVLQGGLREEDAMEKLKVWNGSFRSLFSWS